MCKGEWSISMTECVCVCISKLLYTGRIVFVGLRKVPNLTMGVCVHCSSGMLVWENYGHKGKELVLKQSVHSSVCCT